MKETVQFLFLVDVSGSLHGNRIETVKASLTESIAALMEMKTSTDLDIKVTIATFAEKLQWFQVCQPLDQVVIPPIALEQNSEGFYPITLYHVLLSGLNLLYSDSRWDDGKNGQNTFAVLFSDGMPVDAKECDTEYTKLKQLLKYRESSKYVAFVGDDKDKYSPGTISFVEYKADRIVNAVDMPEEIRKLQQAFLVRSNGEAPSIYSTIFN